MIALRVSEAMAAVNGTWSSVPDPSAWIRSISTDTRHLDRGSLFVGIVGDKFDGAHFAAEAVRQGAVAVIVEEGPGAREELSRLEAATKTAVAVVPDARAALADLAMYVRGRLAAEVIGITGSCGKTSTKAILAELLAAEHEVISSPASFNNEIGVPRTIFLADERTEALVVEIGTNGPGEIAHLSAIAQPRVALVTNVGRSHLEGLGSVEGVAREKGELIASLEGVPEGLAVLNLDCPRTPHLLRRVPSTARVVTVSAAGDSRASLYATDVRMGPDGMRFRFGGELSESPGMEGEIFVSLLGQHAVANVVMGVATMRALNVPLEGSIGRLATLRPEAHRMAPYQLDGVHVIDDTYNANPESVASAVLALADLVLEGGAGRRVLVLGPMGELGDETIELHRAAGEAAFLAGVREFVLVPGADSEPGKRDVRLEGFAQGAEGASANVDGAGAQVHFADSVEGAADLLMGAARPLLSGDVVLCKASRAARLERLVDSLKERLAARASGIRPEGEPPIAREVHA